MMQQEDLLLDPEEETEKQLVNYMAMGIVAVVALLILILALRPWIQRLRQEQMAQEGENP
jgi:flagellar biosynthesis/type III secretory pathway M-ring protein FliF/YscJ